MKNIRMFAVTMTLLCFALVGRAQSLFNTFTYQGQLSVSTGSPVAYNTAVFTVYSLATGGTPLAPPDTNSISVASNGVFTTLINFGALTFSNPPYFLEIDVATNPAGPFTPLLPRQPLTPAPNAGYAFNAGAAASIGGASAASIVSAVNVVNAASTSNIPNTIVVRDPSNSISAGNEVLSGALNLPMPAVIYGGPDAVFLDEGSLYVGDHASSVVNNNDTLHNTGIGDAALFLEAGGGRSGSYNSALGEASLANNSSGNYNTAAGYQSLFTNLSGSYNTALGYQALYTNISGSFNSAFGYQALVDNNGTNNTAVGYQALANNFYGVNNIALGVSAGFNVGGSFNIDIGNTGLPGDSGVIRVGTQGAQGSAYMAGIYGNSISGSTPVFINSSGELGTGGSIPIGNLSSDTFTVNAGTGLSGGGTATLGGAVTLNNAGVIGLYPGGGVSVNQNNGNVTLSSSPITVSLASGLTGSSSVSLGGTLSLSPSPISVSLASGLTGSSSVGLGGTLTLSPSPIAVSLGSGLTGSSSVGLGGTLTINPSAISVSLGSGLSGSSSVGLGGTLSLSLNSSTLPFWSLTGNSGTIPGTDYIGTSDNNRLEVHVNGTRALVLYPDPAGLSSANILGGHSENAIVGTVSGDIIAGGGYNGSPNIISNASFGVISGGSGNLIWPAATNAFIGGGANNWVEASTYAAAIAGGNLNIIGGSYSYIGGGYNNNAANSYVSIGGGSQNTVSGAFSTVGGGASNTVSAAQATVGGGWSNLATYAYATVGGGHQNVAGGGNGATVSGGEYNQAIGDHPYVGGGYHNTANGIQATIGGGYSNVASNEYATIAGGANNVATNSYATVGGGANNSAGGGNAPTVSGGQNNQAIGDHPTVGGGFANTALGTQATVSGGYANLATNSYATVPGGIQNVAGGANSFAAGSYAAATNSGSFVWADNSSGSVFGSANVNNSVSFRCSGGVRFSNGTSGTDDTVSWTPGAASWSFTSDKNAKDRFEDVNPEVVLDKVSALPISEWSYKGYPQRHIGAMAQDFHALFPLNDQDKVLNDADLHGVALAAIKGLNQKLEEQLKAKDARIQSLEERLDRLEKVLSDTSANSHSVAK